jgi:hypothetical protein
LRALANEAAVGAYSPVDGDFVIALDGVLDRVLGIGDFEGGMAGVLGLAQPGVLGRLAEGVFARAAGRDEAGAGEAVGVADADVLRS